MLNFATSVPANDPRLAGLVKLPILTTFEVDDYARWRLLGGLDDIGLTLRHDADIAAYESRRSSLFPAVPV